MDMWIDVSPWDHQRGTQPHHVASWLQMQNLNLTKRKTRQTQEGG
jgi:hypothetical protein